MPVDPTTTVGIIAALVGFIGVLLRDHQRNDADVRSQRDTALSGWRAQTDATNRLADAIESRDAKPRSR